MQGDPEVDIETAKERHGGEGEGFEKKVQIRF